MCPTNILTNIVMFQHVEQIWFIIELGYTLIVWQPLGKFNNKREEKRRKEKKKKRRQDPGQCTLINVCQWDKQHVVVVQTFVLKG